MAPVWSVCFIVNCCLVSVVHGRVQQMTACKARVDNRLINLEPLQRTDRPRFEASENGSFYYYNPCVPFNMPFNDPHSGGGDHCYFVALCQKEGRSQETRSSSYYTLGIQSTGKFNSRPFRSTRVPHQIQTLFKKAYPGFAHLKPASIGDSDSVEKDNSGGGGKQRNDLSRETDGDHNTEDQDGNDLEEKQTSYRMLAVGRNGTVVNVTKQRENSQEHGEKEISSFSSSEEEFLRITYITFKGMRTFRSVKSYIYLLCDPTKRKPSEAVLKLVNVSNSTDKHFTLQHQCCCPDGCTRYGNYDYDYGSGNNTEKGFAELEEETLPEYLWLIVVINGAILTIAVIIGSVFCRNTGHGNGGYYNMLPAIHSSRLTLGASAESLFQAKSKLHQGDYLEYSSALTKAAQLPTAIDGLIDSRDLEVGQRLGGGLFGDTYISEWKERKMAAKRITVNVHQNQMTEEDQQWICKQIVYLSKQKHKHLVVYVGLCLDMNQPYILTEFFEGEALKEVLRRQTEAISWSRRIKVCLQVADALVYLHSAKHSILHRDLRCANILVDQQDRVKVVDYSWTKIMQRLRQKCNGRKGCFCNKNNSAVPGSVRWTAPEVLNNPTADEYTHPDILTPAVDVYSYAMVLWEVATHTDPFEDIPDNKEVVDIVISGGRPPVDSIVGIHCSLQDLMKRCWSHDPDNRPNFKAIYVQMKSILTSVSKRTRTTSSTTQYMKSLLNTHIE